MFCLYGPWSVIQCVTVCTAHGVSYTESVIQCVTVCTAHGVSYTESIIQCVTVCVLLCRSVCQNHFHHILLRDALTVQCDGKQ